MAIVHWPIVMHSTFAGLSKLEPELPPTKVEYLQNAMATRVSVFLGKQAVIPIRTAYYLLVRLTRKPFLVKFY